MGLVEGIFLSDFMIFVLLSAMLLAMTWWAFRAGELAGYALGWLVGIFLVVVYSALFGETAVTVDEIANAEPVQLTMLSVTGASLLGLVGGFAILLFVQLPNPFPLAQRRALTVALLTAMVLIGLYILSSSDEYTRKTLGIFSLAFGIGLLVNIVLNGGTAGARGNGKPPDYPAQNAAGGPPRADSPQSRFDRLRRRIERR